MLLPIVIFLVLIPKTLSSANSVGSAQYPYVAPSPSVSHGRRSGIMQEKECFVSRLCEYKIYEDNFSCKVSEYVISKAGSERNLPKWLWFDARNKTLKGVASPADEGLSEILIVGLSGQQDSPVGHICGLLTVKIVVWSLKYFPLFAQNFPTSLVINDNFSKTSAWRSISCQFNEPIVLATLVFAGNFHEMDGNEKINILDGLLQIYHISLYDVFMLSSSEEDSLSGLLQTSHVLASGPGANRSAAGPSTTITWHVRCGVIHLDDSIFRAMEKLSQQSALIKNVSYAPKGWHVVTGFQKHHVRKRRNIGGTTTPAYSTIPISRATVITTKIKIRRTTSVSPTVTFTWSRPLPTFSSPFIASNTSLHSQSATVSSRFSNTDTSVSSTSPVMTQSRSAFTISQISPSKQQTTEILQYKSVSSTFPVMALSINVSSTSQVSSSRQPISEVSLHSTKMYSEVYSTSGIRHFNNLSTTSQLSSSKLGTFVKPSTSSITASENQSSTTLMILPSKTNITLSIPPTPQSVSNTSLSSSDVSSKIISSLFTTVNHSISTSKTFGVWSATAMTTAQLTNSTTTLLQSSYSNFLNSASPLSPRTYSTVLHVTGSGIINENRSTTVNQMSHESFSSNTLTKSTLSITPSPSINVTVKTDSSFSFYTPTSSGSSVQRSKPTATSFLPCRNSCAILTSSKNTNITPRISDTQDSTTPYLASSLTSERISNSSYSTLVLKRTSVTPQTSDVHKNPGSTRPMITSGIFSKSIQSSGYNISKVTKTLTTNSTINLSRLDTRSKETFQTSSSGTMSSQFSSGWLEESKMMSTSVVNPISTEKTPLAMASQSISSDRSSIFVSSTTTIVSTAMVETLTEQLRSTYSPLIKTSPASTYTSTVQTKTIRSGTLISNVEPNPSISLSFTPQISGVISTSSSISRFDVGHSSLSVSSNLAGSIDLSAIQSKPSRTFSPSIMSSSSLGGSPDRTSSSNEIFEKSTSPVTTTNTTSSSDFPSSTFDTLILSVVTNTSSDVLLSYDTAVPPSTIVTSATLSSVFLSSSYHITLSSTVVTTNPPSVLLPSYHTPTLPSTDVTTTPSSDSLSSSHMPTSPSTFTTTPSSDFLSSYHTPTPPSTVVTTTPSSVFLSSYHTPTSPSTVTTTPLSDMLSSYHTPTLPSTITTTSSSVFLLSYHMPTSPLTVVTTTPSSVLLPSYHMPASPSTVVTTTPSSDFLLSYHTPTSPSTVVTTTPSPVLLPSYHMPTSPSTVTTTPSSVLLPSYYTPSSSSTVVTTTTPSSVFVPFYRTLSLISSDITTTPSSDFLSSYHTPTSISSDITASPSEFFLSFHTPTSSSIVVTTTPSIVLALSYHTLTSPSPVITTTTPQSTVLFTPSDFLSSYHTPTSPSTVLTTTTSSVLLPSYYTPTSPSTVVTTTPSLDSLFSPTTQSFRTSLGNLPSSTASTARSSASYQMFSLSFLSSSIVPSQPSISTDISMMVHPTIESTISYTLTKSSLPNASWHPEPSYTSITMAVITSSTGLLSSTSSESSSSAVILPTTPSKESPKIYNNFDLLRVTVGKVFQMRIPADTFHDREDGNTRNLKLECLSVNHKKLSSDSWLQFNSTTQTLYGLVLKSQLEVIGSSTEYLLTASDHDGNTVYDAFTVDIEDNAKPLAAKFAVKLTKTNLQIFNRDLGNVLSIVQTIAGYYGDKDESLIQVLSLAQGSVIFTWSNTSLQNCDEDLINDLARKMITRRGEIQPYFYNTLSPRFTADEVFVNYTGPCVLQKTQNPSVSELSSHETSLWLKYVLPALVVAVIIVVIAVACLLVRRHSGVKVLKEDKRIFKRRKPIILDGEREMSTLTGKPIELPEDSLSPVRFPRETSFGMPDYYENDISELPSTILPAPSYQKLPPRYSTDGGSNRYNTPPPPYKLPPSYKCYAETISSN